MKRLQIILIAATIILVASGASYWRWQNLVPTQSAQAEIDVLDVGQGDAIYIRASNGDDILIDGGPDATVLERLGQVMPFWDRTIELVVSTHPDSDHSAGLISVFQHYQVGTIMMNDMPVLTATYKRLVEEVAAEHCQVVHPQAGEVWQLGSGESFTVLYPWADTLLADLDTNDTSIFLEYKYVGNARTATALFTGDASELIEQQLVDVGVLSPVDLLKVGHHGSHFSSSQSFVDALQPHYAAISVGADNPFGHPTQEAMDRLQIYAQVLRTDQLGTLRFVVSAEGEVLQENQVFSILSIVF